MNRCMMPMFAICLGCIGADRAVAVPLDAASCEKSRAEQTELYGDVPRLMERGAAWAKQSATSAQLKRVARWIELEEQLQFRCGQVRLSEGATAAAAAAEAMDRPPPPAPGAATLDTAGKGGAASDGDGEVKQLPKTRPKPPNEAPRNAVPANPTAR